MLYNKNMSTNAVKVQVQAQIDLPTVMRQLCKELPLNDFGLPTGIYRSDLLPFHDYDPNPIKSGSAGDNHHASPSNESEEASPSEDSDVAPTGPISTEVTLDDYGVDAHSLLAGEGDGAPDVLGHSRTRNHPPSVQLPPSRPEEYRIAGFLAQSLGKAFVPLQYDEGFPAFESGVAFWDRLTFEPNDAYVAFQRYMLMSRGEAGDPEAEEYEGTAAQGTRSISTMVMQAFSGKPDNEILALVDKFKEFYHLYYWGLRTKGYDLFRVTQYRQQQELRALETQDDHYLQSRKLRHRLTQYMEDDEEFWELMTPKVAIDMHKHLTSLERISAGVPANGPTTKESEGGGQTFEVAFRTIALEQAETSAVDGSGVLIEGGEVLDHALEDPAATKILQELIIRTSGG